MKIEKSEIKDLTGVITMVVEPSDYQDELQKELKQVRQKANIPGFRPGMVPLGLVKKMYGKVIEWTLRTTYVIDEQGVIVDIIRKVDTKNHTAQIIR